MTYRCHLFRYYTVSYYPKNFDMLLLIGGYAWMKQKNNVIYPIVEYAIQHNIPLPTISLKSKQFTMIQV
ncbi:TldD-like protein [Clostridium acetobutylicum EA 2018]|uniref:TldD-like protein n=1 Tax=Clostridium acetobutylicum (strain ATCC 824 / DSM 792 / JCM 1419 / IAM 19013 / LMG 5710 / NBRC 13948 / NRRL B-527 / VKM B-1787 / 2291 / W) TaxID=272562 RepID=Q97I27_CLOAB|nr:TldD-like protein fragment [Clostridium acetobutylicum ATCC 824]ADZ20877.1 TldD-like protein [Clostridium acetobutylicum EA 2018]AEI31983.1 TldD-like protein [Clostridium acetobutylicum DSM 1731]